MSPLPFNRANVTAWLSNVSLGMVIGLVLVGVAYFFGASA